MVDVTPDARFGHFQNADYSLATEIRCAPEGGELNTTAGITFEVDFYMTSDLIQANGCIDPCPDHPLVHGPVLFRDKGDSTAMANTMMDNPYQDQGSTMMAFIVAYTYSMSWIIVYVLIQGLWAIAFGRSEPSESRIRIYELIIRMHRDKNNPPGKFHEGLAMVMAFIGYF